MDQGRIAPHYTTIRIMYTGSIDITYYVNQEGLLEQVGVENPTALEPKEVLSQEKYPDGWEPEGLRPPQKKEQTDGATKNSDLLKKGGGA